MKYKSEFLNILDQRGFVHQCSDFEALDKKLCAGAQSAYVGYDPTGMSLHVGHLYTVMMLHWFQKCGHKPITLMGGGTALIPDPTLKDKTRPLLTPETINKNIDGIKGVFAKFLKYGDGKTDALMVNNYDWLSKLDYISFLREIGTHFTVNRMMTFESVKLRLDRELPMTFIEFNYMILQGYDFLELHRRYGTTLQMGGSDQWGNIINGIELGHKKDGVALYGLTAPLLTTASGQKMGKTEGGAVWLNADMMSPYDYYQFWRNAEDGDVIKLLKIYTFMPLDEIAKLEKLQGQEINEAKKILAFEATKLCHGETAAQEAQITAQKVFEQGGIGGDLPVIEAQSGAALLDIMVELKMAPSKGAARKLVEQGAVKIDNAPVNDTKHAISASTGAEIKISAGKKKHALVKIR